jgi:hypothetical protein
MIDEFNVPSSGRFPVSLLQCWTSQRQPIKPKLRSAPLRYAAPSIHNAHYTYANAFSSRHSAPLLIRFCECLPTPYVCIASENPCAAVVAKYLTSTSSSCCSFSRLGRMVFVMSSVAFWQPCPGVPAFSNAITVPCSGSCFSVLTRTPYDFATLNRMFGISSLTNLSIIGRIDCSMTSRLSAGARVY